VADFENSLYAFNQSEQIVSSMYNNKLPVLLDGVFVISRIIKVKVGVISQSRRPRQLQVGLTKTLIILDITKTNLLIVLLYIEH